MADDSFDRLPPKALNASILKAVASENIDTIPDDFSDSARFVLGSIRAVGRRTDLDAICAFVYSDAASPETNGRHFIRVAHMQDGYGAISGSLVVTNREANNGMTRIFVKA